MTSVIKRLIEDIDSLRVRIERLEESLKKTEGVKTRAKPFTPPLLHEVEEYCSIRGNNVNPQHFIDFYESTGWMIGRNKMKNWQAAVRTWEKNTKTIKDEKEQRFVGRQSAETIKHNANFSYQSAERIRKEMLGNTD